RPVKEDSPARREVFQSRLEQQPPLSEPPGELQNFFLARDDEFGHPVARTSYECLSFTLRIGILLGACFSVGEIRSVTSQVSKPNLGAAPARRMRQRTDRVASRRPEL